MGLTWARRPAQRIGMCLVLLFCIACAEGPTTRHWWSRCRERGRRRPSSWYGTSLSGLRCEASRSNCYPTRSARAPWSHERGGRPPSPRWWRLWGAGSFGARLFRLRSTTRRGSPRWCPGRRAPRAGCGGSPRHPGRDGGHTATLHRHRPSGRREWDPARPASRDDFPKTESSVRVGILGGGRLARQRHAGKRGAAQEAVES